MKVVVSVLGRFHAFDLARELERHGALQRLYTSYPASRAQRFHVPRAKIVGRPFVELLNRKAQRVERMSSGRIDARALPCRLHDRMVAARLIHEADADVFVGWSGSCLSSLTRARRLGMLTLVERGSTHILHQRDVLREEYERAGIEGRLPAGEVVERELAEYDTADRIVVPTAFAARTFVEHGVSPERLIQVPYGVSLESFALPKGGRTEQSEFTLMHCGNVSLRKGCHHLLRAFAELDLPNARLVFVGPIADEMRPIVARVVDPRVAFLGEVPQAALSRHYGRASAFCLASIEEGMAMVVPQAMATGLPVIATEATGAAEIVRNGRDGRIVAAGDAVALKAAILELYENAELRLEMGRNAAQRVRAGFTWCAYGDKIHAAYERALRAKRAQRRSA